MASKLRGQVQKYRVVNGLVLSQSSSSIHTLVVEATLHRPINKTFIIRKGWGSEACPRNHRASQQRTAIQPLSYSRPLQRRDMKDRVTSSNSFRLLNTEWTVNNETYQFPFCLSAKKGLTSTTFLTSLEAEWSNHNTIILYLVKYSQQTTMRKSSCSVPPSFF